MNGSSITPHQQKLQALQQLLPEAFAEGKIDWEKLKATLGEDINFSNERYVLNWAGKSDAFKVLQTPSMQTLIPIKNESVHFDTTQHIFIEGENLEVLKILQKSYFGKIKMIYIDPPYNTGNDHFIYPDKFSESIAEYEKRVGDTDQDGYMTKDGMFKKNSKENGQYHSNWLNMMMPRLYLAKNLLTQNGVIFVSIDDNEVHNLRLLMNEIFGEENFVAEIVIKSNPGGRDYGGIALTHEYILVYSKIQNDLNLIENKNKKFQYRDELGDFDARELRNRNIKFNQNNRPNLCYPIYVNPLKKDINELYEISLNKIDNYIEVMPLKSQGIQTVWRWGKEKVLKNLNIDVKAKLKQDGSFMIIEKYRSIFERLRSIFDETDYRNEYGSLKIKELFEKKPFDYPKSTELLKKIILLGSSPSDLILDFFAGSGTTAHAVMELNKEDGGNRKFICVQMRELCKEESEAYKAGYKTIADISKERIRRASKKIHTELEEEKKKKASQFNFENKDNQGTNIDLGFKVFKLANSNFKQWQQIKNNNTEELTEQIKLFIDPIAHNATIENMVFEFLLKTGNNLNSNIEKINDVFVINKGELILLLENISAEIIEQVIAQKPTKVIALDKLFNGNDQLKTNTVLQMRDALIIFKTV